ERIGALPASRRCPVGAVQPCRISTTAALAGERIGRRARPCPRRRAAGPSPFAARDGLAKRSTLFPKFCVTAYYDSTPAAADSAMSSSQSSAPMNRPPNGGLPLTRDVADEAALVAQERNPRTQQLLFIYGSGLGIGLHIALLQLALFHSWSNSLFTVGGSVLYATLALVLWQTVFPHFADYAQPWRIVLQILVAVVSLTVLSVLLTELHALLLGGNSILQRYDGGDRTIVISAESIRHAPLIFALVPVVPM